MQSSRQTVTERITVLLEKMLRGDSKSQQWKKVLFCGCVISKGTTWQFWKESEVRETGLSMREGRGPFIGKTLGRHHIVFRGKGSTVPGQVVLSSHHALDQMTLLGGKPWLICMVS